MIFTKENHFSICFIGDSVGSCSEDDVLIPDTQELSCPNYPEPHKNHDEKISELSCNTADSISNSANKRTETHDMDANTSNKTKTSETIPSALFTPGYVTLEALENTKVAVAQFAATALANGADQNALKELAMLQSTLYTLQHQQVYQIKLIEELQSQLAKRTTSTPTTTSSDIVSEKSDEIIMHEIDMKKDEQNNCDESDSKSIGNSASKVSETKVKVVNISEMQKDHIKESVSIPCINDVSEPR